MATTKNGTYYPSNYDEVADVPTDMKKMAESIDKQLDSKVDKVEGKGLSTNDFTNEDKDKLDGLSNYDDSEIKQDIADIQDKNTSQDELIAKLKDNMFNLTAEGTSINVQDASDLPAVLEVSGGVRQDGREGYNLFNSDKALTSQTKTQGGATVTKNNDKSFTVTGSGNLTASFGGGYIDYTNEKKIKNLKIGQYTCYFGVTTYPLCAIQFFKKENDKDTLLISRDNNSNIKAVIDITDEIINSTGLFIRVYLYGASGRQIVPGTIYPMLYEGTEEKPFEAYGATPSPDYPSEVEVVEGSLEINKVNKNFLPSFNDLQETNKNGLTYSIKNKKKKIKGTSTTDGSFSINISENTTLNNGNYYLKSSKAIGNMSCNLYDTNNKKITDLGWNMTNRKFTINGQTTIRKQVDLFYGSGATFDFEGYLFITNQEEITDYISHESEVYNLAIQQPMLSGDTFVKEDGNWFEVHGWKKVVLTGNENITYYNAPDTDRANTALTAYFAIDLPSYGENNDNKKGNVFCNYFNNLFDAGGLWASANSEALNKEAVALQGTLRLRIYKTRLTNYSNDMTSAEKVNLLKQYLTDRHNEEKPVYIWYKLATPTKLPCTPEQVEVLEQLYNMPTYRPVTNIFTQDDLAKLKLNYVADSKIYVDNRINELKANLDTINQLLSTTATSALLLNNMQSDLESEVM